MGKIINFFSNSSRSSAQRLAIINRYNESDVSSNYMQYGLDYFDNPEHILGYHGYKYDGRYAKAVAQIVDHYKLAPGMSILEIGCAKGFVLLEFLKFGIKVFGLDYSEYAIRNSHPSVKKFIVRGDSRIMPFKNKQFDFIIAKEILPHLSMENLLSTLIECKRLSHNSKYFFEIQCGTTPKELNYMKQWDRTHQTVKTPEWWNSLFETYLPECDVHYNILIKEE